MEHTDETPEPEGRTVPLWVFLLGILIGLLSIIGFGYIVQRAALSYSHPGIVAKVAIEIAGSPDNVADALSDLWGYVSGTYVDDAIRTPRPDRDYSAYTPLAGSENFGLDGLLIEPSKDGAQDGWRIVLGAFAINGEMENAAILVDPEMKIERVWEVTEPDRIGIMSAQPNFRKFVHGFKYLNDGSFLVTFDGGISLQRFDACGKRLWASPGYYSHTVNTTNGDKSAWVVGPDKIVEISVEDGKVLRTISMETLVKTNPEIDILEVRQLADNDLGNNSRNTRGNWLPDPFHLNDVDPLPAHLADRYEALGFEPDDLLVSARSANLVFVLDPDNGKVKWWRMGATKRQHDPDWEEDGTITIFNNRMGRDYSEIVKMDPNTYEMDVLVDGRQNDFYSRIRGKHQTLPNGNILVTSPQQGEAFEVTPDGETVFRLVNFKPGDETANYVISEVLWLPSDKVKIEPCSD